jgi:hypothetical protein
MEISLFALPVLSWPFFANRFISVWYWVTKIPPPSYFIFIHWFIVLVSQSPSCFGCYSPLFHTLVFILSPSPAPVCLQQRSTNIFLPSYCFCFVFIYQLHGLLTFLISFSHFGHIDGFLCFSVLAGTTLPTLITTLTLLHINPVLGFQSFLWILDPWRWDRYFVPKRQYGIVITHCVITQKKRGSQNSYYKVLLVTFPCFNAIMLG